MGTAQISESGNTTNDVTGITTYTTTSPNALKVAVDLRELNLAAMMALGGTSARHF
jgi:hypothetical protein